MTGATRATGAAGTSTRAILRARLGGGTVETVAAVRCRGPERSSCRGCASGGSTTVASSFAVVISGSVGSRGYGESSRGFACATPDESADASANRSAAGTVSGRVVSLGSLSYTKRRSAGCREAPRVRGIGLTYVSAHANPEVPFPQTKNMPTKRIKKTRPAFAGRGRRVRKPGSVASSSCPERSQRSFIWDARYRDASCGLPWSIGRAALKRSSTWPCSGWGLPCRARYRTRGGLLLRRFTLTRDGKTVSGGLLFCGTFLEVSLTGRYPASCPVEPGLSSRPKPSDRLSRCDGRKRSSEAAIRRVRVRRTDRPNAHELGA